MSTIHVCDRCKAATTKPTVVVLMDIRTVQSEHPGRLRLVPGGMERWRAEAIGDIAS